MEFISDEEWHLLTEPEIQRAPEQYGVLMLADGFGTVIDVVDGVLTHVIRSAKAEHPKATRFRIRRFNSVIEAQELAAVLRKEYGLDKEPIGFKQPA